VATFWERLAEDKQRSHGYHMERFNFKKLNQVEDKEQYCVDVRNGVREILDI
jgi:hypothetical protein